VGDQGELRTGLEESEGNGERRTRRNREKFVMMGRGERGNGKKDGKEECQSKLEMREKGV
jgi:hypothetical protein